MGGGARLDGQVALVRASRMQTNLKGLLEATASVRRFEWSEGASSGPSHAETRWCVANGVRIQRRFNDEGKQEMPNWMHSGFEVTGAPAEVARFKSMMLRPITEADRIFDPHRSGIVLDFNGILPMPPEEALSNYVGWASLNWGVDRNADNLTIHSDEENLIRFQFDTPWEFPTPVFEALAREFPGLVFSGSAFEDSDGNEWKGEFNGANDWGPGEIEWVVNTSLTRDDDEALV